MIAALCLRAESEGLTAADIAPLALVSVSGLRIPDDARAAARAIGVLGNDRIHVAAWAAEFLPTVVEYMAILENEPGGKLPWETQGIGLFSAESLPALRGEPFGRPAHTPQLLDNSSADVLLLTCHAACSTKPLSMEF